MPAFPPSDVTDQPSDLAVFLADSTDAILTAALSSEALGIRIVVVVVVGCVVALVVVVVVVVAALVVVVVVCDVD